VLPTYDSMTRRELRDVAKKYLDFDRATVVWAVPAAEQAPAGRKRAAKKRTVSRATAKKVAKKTKKKATKARRVVAKGKQKAGRKKS